MQDSQGWIAQTHSGRCPLLDLPGELRNRIYSHVLDDCWVYEKHGGKLSKIRRLRRLHPEIEQALNCPNKASLWATNYGFAQVCRTIRDELLPLFRAHVAVYIGPGDIYDYIDTFLKVPGMSEEQIVGTIILDFYGDGKLEHDTETDMRPLLRLLRTAKNLYVAAHDIVHYTTTDDWIDYPHPSLIDILVHLYDIVDLESFYEYVERAMTALVVESSEAKGMEIIFELGPGYWEDWMGIWSKPVQDRDSHFHIPLEQQDMVVEWGRTCGMELNRATGSHLTVNFRQG